MTLIESVTRSDGKVILYDRSSLFAESSRQVYASTCGKYVIKEDPRKYSQNERELSAYAALRASGAIERAETYGVSVPDTWSGHCESSGDAVVVMERITGEQAKGSWDNAGQRYYTNHAVELAELVFPDNHDIAACNVVVGPEGDAWVIDLGCDASGGES